MMPDTDSLSSFAQLRQRLAEWLRTYRPTPRTYITAACVGATVGQYAAITGSSDPTAIAAAVAALGAQLGVNLLADIIGNRPAPLTLTVELMRRGVVLTHPAKSFHSH